MITLYYIIQFTWGIIQNLYSLIFYIHYIRCEHFVYNGSIVTVWDKEYSQGLGCFIFISKNSNSEILTHEYGHTIQSVILGPLFLPLIAIPSGVWCFSKKLKDYRKEKRISYYSFYTEKWANILGEKITGNSTPV